MEQENKGLSEEEQIEIVKKICDTAKEKYETFCCKSTRGHDVLIWPKGVNSGYVYDFYLLYDSKYIFTGPLGFWGDDEEEWEVPDVGYLKSDFTLDDIDVAVQEINDFLQEYLVSGFYNIENVVEEFSDVTSCELQDKECNELQQIYNFLKEEYNVAYKEWNEKPIVLFWHKDSNEGLLFYIGIDNEYNDYIAYGAVACDKGRIWFPYLNSRLFPYSRDQVLELAQIIERSYDWRFPDIKATVKAYQKWLEYLMLRKKTILDLNGQQVCCSIIFKQ